MTEPTTVSSEITEQTTETESVTEPKDGREQSPASFLDSPDKNPSIFNKSAVTNAITLMVIGVAWFLPDPAGAILMSVGLFAFSGAVTNWLAVHMLFEKVPFLYGSGVIPTRFEEFKGGIHQLMKEQFFNRQNIERFLGEAGIGAKKSSSGGGINWGAILDDVDLNPAFESLKEAVRESPFGGMLNMFGGESALEPLRGPFAEKMKNSIQKIASTDAFQASLKKHLSGSISSDALLEHVDVVIHERLEEMTPSMVKDIIQKMIRIHLGWLVVWGGVFGGLMGLIAYFIQ